MRKKHHYPPESPFKIDWPNAKRKLYKALKLNKYPTFTLTQKKDIVFHLGDCIGDVEQLFDFYCRPGKYTPSQVYWVLNEISVHAINHLAAVARIFRGDSLLDVFDLGLFDVTSKKKHKTLHKHCPKQPKNID
jgi:hypothetical protein